MSCQEIRAGRWGGGPEDPSPTWLVALVLSFLLTLGRLEVGVRGGEEVETVVLGSVIGQVPRRASVLRPRAAHTARAVRTR